MAITFRTSGPFVEIDLLFWLCHFHYFEAAALNIASLVATSVINLDPIVVVRGAEGQELALRVSHRHPSRLLSLLHLNVFKVAFLSVDVVTFAEICDGFTRKLWHDVELCVLQEGQLDRVHLEPLHLLIDPRVATWSDRCHLLIL